METYYTKKEYDEMKSILNRKLKAGDKKIAFISVLTPLTFSKTYIYKQNGCKMA